MEGILGLRSLVHIVNRLDLHKLKMVINLTTLSLREKITPDGCHDYVKGGGRGALAVTTSRLNCHLYDFKECVATNATQSQGVYC